jgi:hypothetical protein
LTEDQVENDQQKRIQKRFEEEQRNTWRNKQGTGKSNPQEIKERLATDLFKSSLQDITIDNPMRTS